MMMKHIILIFGFFIVSINSPAFSKAMLSQPAISCVQKQMNILGFNAGNADGILNKKTIEATIIFRASLGSKDNSIDYDLILDLAPLALTNAQLWCKTIAKKYPKLDNFTQENTANQIPIQSR